MTMNQYFTFPQQLMYVKKTNWSFYNRTLPKSNLKSGSAPDTCIVYIKTDNIYKDITEDVETRFGNQIDRYQKKR